MAVAAMEVNMYAALAGFFVLLNIGILMAFAMDGLALRRAPARVRLARPKRSNRLLKKFTSGAR
jgi:hypothetical protein